MRSLAFIFALALASCSTQSRTNCLLVKNADLPVTFNHNHLPVVDVSIDGRILHMVVDTGSDESLITRAGAKTIGASYVYAGWARAYGANGEVNSNSVEIPNLKLDGLTVTNAVFFATDLFSSNGSEPDHIDGLIGQNILKDFNVALDFPNNRIALFQRDGCNTNPPWPGQFATEHFQGGTSYIEVPFFLDGKPLTGLLDTGAAELTFRQTALADAGIKPEAIIGVSETVGIGARTGKAIAERFKSVTIGGEVFHKPVLYVSKLSALDAGALIGENYLRWHRVYIDYDTDTVWLGLS